MEPWEAEGRTQVPSSGPDGLQSAATAAPTCTAHSCLCLRPEPFYPRRMALAKGGCGKPGVIPGSSLELERALDTESKAWV